MSAKTKSPVVKWILGVSVTGLLLLVLTYVVLTSSWFITSMVLPKVAEALQARLTVTSASLSGLSRLTLENVRLDIGGPDPLATVERIEARVSLGSLLSGKPVVESVTLLSPAIAVVREANGNDPLAQWLAKLSSKPATPPSTPQTAAAPPQFLLKTLALKNGSLRFEDRQTNSGPVRFDVSSLNLDISNLGNASQASIQVAGNLQGSSANKAQPMGIDASLKSSITLGLDAALLPNLAKAQLGLDVTKASGTLRDAQSAQIELIADYDAGKLRQLRLDLKKAGRSLGSLALAGTVDPAAGTGAIDINVAGVDRHLLNLALAAAAIDVGSTRIDSTNHIEFSKTRVAARGRWTANSTELVLGTRSTPRVDADVAFAVAVDLASKSLELSTLALQVRSQQTPLVSASLDKPMSLSWGTAAGGVGDASMLLQVTNLNLASWADPFSPGQVRGRLDARSTLGSSKSGKNIALTLTADVTGLELPAITNLAGPLSVSVSGNAQAENLDTAQLTALDVRVRGAESPWLTFHADGSGVASTHKVSLATTLNLDLPGALRSLRLPQGISVSGGTVSANTTVRADGPALTITNSSSLQGFAGVFSGTTLSGVSATAGVHLLSDGKKLSIPRAELQLPDRGGTVLAQGEQDLASGKGHWSLTVDNVTEKGLKPFVTAFGGGTELVSLRLNGKTTADLNGESLALRSHTGIENLRVRPVGLTLAPPPVQAALDLVFSRNGSRFNIEPLTLALSPTPTSPNKIEIQARLDLGTNSPAPSEIKIRSAGIDLTPIADYVAPPTNTVATTKPTPAPGPEVEPGPIQLPIRSLTLDLLIDQLVFREAKATNIVIKGSLEKGQLKVAPASLHLNGAPIESELALDLDRVAPGYAFKFTAAKVPIEPIANSFLPSQRGQYIGDLEAIASLQGTGITSSNLQRHLSGNVVFLFTNATIHVVSPKTKALLTPIVSLLGAPDLLDSPLDWIRARADIGAGRISIPGADLHSPAFQARLAGDIKLGVPLTNSVIDLPVDLALRPSLARKTGLGQPANDVDYVTLPRFARVTGTLGLPRTETDKGVLAGLFLKSSVRLPVAVGQKAGSLIEGLGNILTDKAGTKNNTPAAGSTPATPGTPTTPERKPSDLLQDIGNIFKPAPPKTTTTPLPPADSTKPATPAAPTMPTPQPAAPAPKPPAPKP